MKYLRKYNESFKIGDIKIQKIKIEDIDGSIYYHTRK